MSGLISTAFTETARGLRTQLREAALDHAAFEAALRPCELGECRATCCHDGAVLSREEASHIRELVARHPTSFPAAAQTGGVHEESGSLKTGTQSATPAEVARDFPAHFPRTRCVFLLPDHRCSLQTLSGSLARHPWFYKPLSCWMHPVRLQAGEGPGGRSVLTLLSPTTDHACFASCTPCGRPDASGQPARKVLAPELRALSEIADRDFVAELNAPAAPNNH